MSRRDITKTLEKSPESILNDIREPYQWAGGSGYFWIYKYFLFFPSDIISKSVTTERSQRWIRKTNGQNFRTAIVLYIPIIVAMCFLPGKWVLPNMSCLRRRSQRCQTSLKRKISKKGNRCIPERSNPYKNHVQAKATWKNNQFNRKNILPVFS